MAIFLTFGATAQAQDDDVYFVPSKKKEVAKKQTARPQSSYTPLGSSAGEADNWAEGRGNNGWDVDAYNRRQQAADTVAVENLSADEPEGTYTARLVRFHSPRAGVVVSSPYYTVLTDYYWYDPWLFPYGYDPFYASWYGWGWSPYWHGSYWHHWGHHHYWWDYSWNWGWHPHGPGFWPGHWGGTVPAPGRPSGGRYLDTSRRVTAMRPSRGFGDSSRGNASNRPSRNYLNSSAPSNRSNGLTTRPGRSFSNSSNGPSRRNDSYSPSRSFGNSSNSSRTFSTPSRSSSPAGGGRSFGGGGGRSGGGRR